MADPRFFKNHGPFRLSELAQATGAALEGDDRSITDVAPLDKASKDHLSFLDNTKYIAMFEATQAGACFVHPKFKHRAPEGLSLLVTEEPYAAFALASAQFYPLTNPATGIHPTAIVPASATLGKDVSIGAYTVIGEGVQIGDGTSIGAHCSISHALIGSHVLIHRGVQIGQDGFGFAPSKTGIVKVPQLGRVIIEDHVEIGSNTCIDRGTGPDTIIGAHSKLDNLVQIGHNVRLGRYVLIAAQTGISGSTVVEDGVMIGGQVGLAGHLTIGKGAKLAAQSGVMGDIPAGMSYMGTPAMPMKAHLRHVATLKKLSNRDD